jgi:hypothetical protein
MTKIPGIRPTGFFSTNNYGAYFYLHLFSFKTPIFSVNKI